MADVAARVGLGRALPADPPTVRGLVAAAVDWLVFGLLFWSVVESRWPR